MSNKFKLFLFIIGLLMILMFMWLGREDKPNPTIATIDAEGLTEVQIDSILMDYNFQYEAPILIDSSDVVLIPISTKLAGDNKHRKTYGYGSSYDYSYQSSNYWNILFYNKITGSTRLLTENRMSISVIAPLNRNYDREGVVFFPDKILYKIADKDSNKNKKLDQKDIQYLYASDLDGKRLQKVSPPEEDLLDYKILPKSDQILLKTRRDKNNDGQLDKKDESIWYSAKWMNDNWKLTELIDSTGRKRIENLYFDQWLKKN